MKALLATRGLETNRHSAVMRLFGRDFVEPGRMSSKHSRNLVSYWSAGCRPTNDVDPDFTEEKAREHLGQARDFVAAASGLLDEILAED